MKYGEDDMKIRLYLVIFLVACSGDGSGYFGDDEEPNDTTGTAQGIAVPFSVSGGLHVPTPAGGGDEYDYFSLDTVAGVDYTATISNISKDCDLYYIGLDSYGTQVENGYSATDAPYDGATESVSFTATSGVSYYIVAEAWVLGPIPYDLSVTSP